MRGGGSGDEHARCNGQCEDFEVRSHNVSWCAKAAALMVERGKQRPLMGAGVGAKRIASSRAYAGARGVALAVLIG